MDFAISMGLGGMVVLIVGALVVGVAAQLIGEAHTSYEWIATSIGAGLGAVFASEFLTSFRTFEPVWDGLALVPAVIGGTVVALVVAVVTRYATGGTYVHHTT